MVLHWKGTDMLKRFPLIISLLMTFHLLFFFGLTMEGRAESKVISRNSGLEEQKIHWFERGIKKTAWRSKNEIAFFSEKGKAIKGTRTKQFRQYFPGSLETKKNSFVTFLNTREPIEKEKLTAKLNQARQNLGARQASPVFYLGVSKKTDEQMVLTGEIIVQYPAHLSEAQILSIEKKYNLRRLKTFGFVGNTFKYWAGHSLSSLDTANHLHESGNVNYAYPNWLRKRSKKATPDDPLFSDQWHLDSTISSNVDITGVWDTYKGSTNEIIAIVDDGVEINHEDLAANVLAGKSWDFVDGDSDPSPATVDDNHGTACAGIAVARGFNGQGIAGAAPFSSFVAHRLLGAETDANTASALTLNSQLIDIYSNSWGPHDDPHLEGPGPLTEDAIATGAAAGRGGLGNIFVWAGGNGEAERDNSNFDGYANSRYTVAVAASDNNGEQAPYSEQGANILINAPSDGGSKRITTTDRTGSDGYWYNNYYSYFGGTSSSTALVSGIIALMLEANPSLTWRDVQHILMFTADHNDPTDDDWTANGAGYLINHKYGFGRINAIRAVEESISWISAGPEVSVQESSSPNLPIPDSDYTGITDTISIPSDINIEFVEIYFTSSDHPSWGDLEIILTSPEGTTSVLSKTNATVSSNTPYSNWRFGSVRHFAESSMGDWRLTVRDAYTGDVGTFQSWTLKIYGTDNGPGDRVQFSTNSYSVNEDEGSITIPVVRRGSGQGTVAVDYATFDDSAADGPDYIGTSGTLTFEDGETEKSFTIIVLEDSWFDIDDEGTEMVKLKLSNPSGGAVIGNPPMARLAVLGSGPKKHVVGSSLNWPNDVSAADIDGDGDLDIICAGTKYNGSIKWWENSDGSGSEWILRGSYGYRISSVTTADIDGDGDLDIIGGSDLEDTISWWENTDGKGSFAIQRHEIADWFIGAQAVYAADVDGDGDMDVIGASDRGRDIIWWENRWSGTHWEEHVVDNNKETSSVYATDMDSDGDIDIIATQDGISWWENTNGSGQSWNKHVVHTNGAYDVTVADMDHDGDMDLIGGSLSSGLAWWENLDGSATSWLEHTVDPDSGGARSVQVADVDGDGDLDVLGAINHEITWWENGDGLGTSWNKHTAGDGFSGASSVYAADIDSDGDIDILGAAADADEIAWWENSLPILSITLPQGVTEGDGVLINQGTINLHPASLIDIFVNLFSNDTSEISIPSTIIVPAGQTSVDFDLMVQDDDILDGSVYSAINASAPNCVPGARQILIHDNEGAVLTVQVPETAKEGDGMLFGQGTITVNQIVDADVTISLYSNDITEVTVPETITLFSGTNSALFNLQIINDAICGDTQNATITASVNGWTSESGVIEIWDGTSKVRFSQASYFCYENEGSVSVNIKRRNCIEQPVTVDYTTSNGTATAGLDYETATGTLTFEAGESIKSFSVILIDNDLYQDEGTKTINIRLSNPFVGCTLEDPQAATITIWDNDPRKHSVDTNVNGVTSVHAADVDGDGDTDILATVDDSIFLWVNADGTGTSWNKKWVELIFRGASSVSAVDMDNDGDMDILGTASEDDDVTWWENKDGTGEWLMSHSVDLDFDGAKSAFAADIDGDGDMDIIGVATYEDNITWWENMGDGITWTEHTIVVNFDLVRSLSASDMDGDGDIDIVGADYFDADITWWENIDGQAVSWAERTIEDNSDSSLTSIITSDLDNDGDMDILSAEYVYPSQSYIIAWWKNMDGKGSSWNKNIIDEDLKGLRIECVADIDSDGNLDIVGIVDSSVLWWKNMDGHGLPWNKYALHDRYDFEGAISSYAADMDGDGDLDILGAAYSDSDIAWWENPLYTSYRLMVYKNGTGTGGVNSSPAGVDCGVQCTELYDPNTVVTLTADPDPNSVFAGWSGGGCTGTGDCIVVMDEIKEVWARFEFDTDGDGIADNVDPDDDNDGMSDDWENTYPGLDSLANDAFYDLDGDGFCNLREFFSGSIPDDQGDIPSCWADVHGDGDVDGEDMAAFMEEFVENNCPCTFDLNVDGVVDDLDLLFFGEDYGRMDCQ